jgi:YHS domain-containing protein
MNKIWIALCCLVLWTACKDKNATGKGALPDTFGRTGSTGSQAAVGRLSQAADGTTLEWAGDTDPICDMKVNQTAEDTAHYQGKLYGFCSESCKEKFQENPQKWAGK